MEPENPEGLSGPVCFARDEIGADGIKDLRLEASRFCGVSLFQGEGDKHETSEHPPRPKAEGKVSAR